MQEKRPRSTTISSTTVSSMPPGAPGALPVLPLGMCWQLQDGPDYHLSWGRGQGRLRRCGGVLWAFKRRKCVEIAKRALLAHLGLEHAGRGGGAGGGYGVQARCVLHWSRYDTIIHGNRLPASPHATQGRGPASTTSSWAAARHPWLSMATGGVDSPKVATLATRGA